MKRIKFGLAIVAICFASVQVQAQVKVKSAPKKIYLSCNTEDPMPSIAIDTTKTNRGMADNNFLWDNGKVLVVKLLSGSKTLKDKVKKYASEWEKYANIKFKFVETGDAQIRVYLGDKQGDFGHVTMGLGIRCLERSAADFTMHFDTTDLTEEASLKGTVLHEFGHALGLMHEHFYPKSAIQWDSAAVYTRKRMSGWSKAMTDAQIFRKFNSSYTNGTQYDPKSIMHYPVSPWETKNRYSVGHNTELSEGDKALIAALYPKGIRKHEVPRVTITNVGTFGSLMGTPIINQPQVAILAVGAIKKRPVVVETPEGDTIGIRHMMYLSLSYDHRVVDGSIGASFLTAVAKEFEKWDMNKEW